MNNRNIYIFTILIALLFAAGRSSAQQEEQFGMLFYNVENLFDIVDDPATADDEFTPEGEKHWTSLRYHHKLDQLARSITAAGGWELPALLALCEVENRAVLEDLAGHRLLTRAGYRIIHRDSPDRRGIDVALLYDPSRIGNPGNSWISISFPGDSSLRTRDILHARVVLPSNDSLHIFVNHWPSRWGGVEATMPKRVRVASMLRSAVDSVYTEDREALVVITGDFNDNPGDSSVYRVLEARPIKEEGYSLYNLARGFSGTLKYKSNWEVYDQVIVSSALLDHQRIRILDAGVFKADFLLEKDERHLGSKPFRTYSGPRYLGGFSDHLPVYIHFQVAGGENEEGE